MNSPYTQAKLHYGARFVLAVMAMALGAALARFSGPLGILIAVFAVFSAIENFSRLTRVFAAERELRGSGGADLNERYRRESLPRQLFRLLYTVAEIDGRAGERKRELVRQFLLSRFLDPEIIAELVSWRAEPVPADQLSSLIHEIRARITRSECTSLFYWCALVTLIDERFRQAEHEILQTVAHHLGLHGAEARTIFLHAKSRVMSGRGSTHGGFERAARRPDRRARAYQTLGLPATAAADEIRRRHRELVKRHHPDAHSHLGPVAQREATERFREIQEAYEILNGGR